MASELSSFNWLDFDTFDACVALHAAYANDQEDDPWPLRKNKAKRANRRRTKAVRFLGRNRKPRRMFQWAREYYPSFTDFKVPTLREELALSAAEIMALDIQVAMMEGVMEAEEREAERAYYDSLC